MIPFKCIYTPQHSGGQSETVLVVDIVYATDRYPLNIKAIFIHRDGRLDSGSINCFTKCEWKENK